MYEMATGRDPFWDATTVFELINRHVHALPPSLYQANPSTALSQKVEALIFKALEKNPADRYQTAQELQNAIVQACSQDSGNIAFHPGVSARTSTSGSVESQSPECYGTSSQQSQQVAWFDGMLNVGAPSQRLETPFAEAPAPDRDSSPVSERTGEQSSHLDETYNRFGPGTSRSITPDLTDIPRDLRSAGSVAPAPQLQLPRGSKMQGSVERSAPQPSVSNLRARSFPEEKSLWVPILAVLVVLLGLICCFAVLPSFFNRDKTVSATSADRQPAQPQPPAADSAGVDTTNGTTSSKPDAQILKPPAPARKPVQRALRKSQPPRAASTASKAKTPRSSRSVSKPAQSGKDRWDAIDRLRSAGSKSGN
jgi:serine/threonine protein kinase